MPHARIAPLDPARLATAVALLLALISTLGGCSSEALYATGRNAQRAQCMKHEDAGERDRCLKDAGMSHDDYQRQSEQK